jgi:uncharacterized protein YdiU (UPF0061 family)
LESILERYQTQYQQAYLEMMQNKLGLFSLKEDDRQLIQMLTENLQLTETDMTIFFRKLSEIKNKTIEDAFELIKNPSIK